VTRRSIIPTIRLDLEDVKPVQVQGEPEGTVYDPVTREVQQTEDTALQDWLDVIRPIEFSDWIMGGRIR
jgi:hypothetical protein